MVEGMIDGGTYITIKDALMLAIFVGVYTILVLLIGVAVARVCRGEVAEKKRREKVPQEPTGHDLKGQEPDFGDVFNEALLDPEGQPEGQEERRIPTMRGA